MIEAMSSAATTGWFTLGAALGGVLLTGTATYLVTRESHSREQRRQLRTERLAAYTGYLAMYARWKQLALFVSHGDEQSREGLTDALRESAERSAAMNLLADADVRAAAARCLAGFLAASMNAMKGKPVGVDLDELEIGLYGAMRRELARGAAAPDLATGGSNAVAASLAEFGYPGPDER